MDKNIKQKNKESQSNLASSVLSRINDEKKELAAKLKKKMIPQDLDRTWSDEKKFVLNKHRVAGSEDAKILEDKPETVRKINTIHELGDRKLEGVKKKSWFQKIFTPRGGKVFPASMVNSPLGLSSMGV